MKNNLLIQVLIALALAVLAGWWTGPDAQLFGISVVKIYSLIGQLFLNALNLVVVPLVSTSIILGVARMGSEGSFGRLGAKTIGFFVATMFIAIMVGVSFFLLFSPGTPNESMALVSSSFGSQAAEITSQTQGDAFDKISQVILKLIPNNIFAAAAQGQMIGLILFSIVFGFFLSKIESQPASTVLNAAKGIFQVMMRITHLVMRAMPIGVFGLVAKTIATTGIESIASTAYFFLTVIIALLIYAGIILPLLLVSIGRVNPLLHFRAMAPALFTAFSTSSSAATLPITLECVEKRAGVSNRISSFVLPLGTSLNLTGSALYQAVTVLFIAHIYGFELSIPNLAVIILMTLLTGMGVAGIPSATLFSAVVVLHAIGVPAEGIGLIMPVERIIDMCRTTVNVFGTSCCAVMIARTEGEKEVLAATPLTNSQALE